jgi:HlyD family secretion protein
MKLSTVALFLLGLIIGAGGMYFVKHRSGSSPASGQPVSPNKQARGVSALGRIQPSGGVISLGVTLPDILAKLLVEEGQDVKEGDMLAELAGRKERQLQLGLLDSQIKDAEQKLKDIERSGGLQLALDEWQVKQIKNQGPFDVKMQRSKVDFLKKQTEQAQTGLDLIAPLESVSKQEKDRQEMALWQSQAELAAAEDLLQKLTVGQELNVQLAEAKLSLSKANLERARQEVPLASLKVQRELAAAHVAQTFLTAPSKGRVLRILARPGELVGAPQPIVQMADLSRMAVVAEVYETDISKVYDGQKVEITSPVDTARKMTGKVVSVGSLIGKNRVYDADPLADVDRRVIEVKILLDEPALAAGLINLQVNVDFQARLSP